jgi:hypothetical protein
MSFAGGNDSLHYPREQLFSMALCTGYALACERT